MFSSAIDWPNAVDRFSAVSTSGSSPESTTLPSAVVALARAPPPTAHHGVAGGDDKAADDRLVWHARRQGRAAQPDARAQRGHVAAAQALAEHERGARRWILHGRGDAQQRRLAR